MINTVDFITPPVDDPYWFGQIAAANAISDIYAMGGCPVTALNLVMFPSKMLDMGILREIIRGGHDKVKEAGAVLAGGHSVDDEEPKYGLCVNGTVHPDKILTNIGCRSGDALILTKPLGTGVLFNAIRSGRLPFKEVETDVLPTVASLNGPSMSTALKFDIHACTDVTGFGLAGHLKEMAIGSNMGIRLRFSELQFYPNAHEMYIKGVKTGSNKANRQMVDGQLELKVPISETEEELLYDPQTSGGLLISIPEAQSQALLDALAAAGNHAAFIIGAVTDKISGIEVV